MEELYSETYLRAKTPAKRSALRIFLIVLCVVLVLVDVLVLHSSLGLFVVVIADALIIYFLPTKNIAYEYIFVDGQIDFDCIYNGDRRKTLMRIDLGKVDVVAPEGSHALDSYSRLALKDFSSGVSEDRHYIAVYRGEKDSVRIRFTPDEKMLENMKMKARSKIQS